MQETDAGLISGWGRSPGVGNGNPLQGSCLKNPRDGGAWWAAVYVKILELWEQHKPFEGSICLITAITLCFPRWSTHSTVSLMCNYS